MYERARGERIGGGQRRKKKEGEISKLTGGVTLGIPAAADALVAAAAPPPVMSSSLSALAAAAEGAAYVSVAGAALEAPSGLAAAEAWPGAAEEEGVELAISAVGSLTPRGSQTSLAKARVFCWSAGEQSSEMVAPTASRNCCDLQMQVKSVRVHEVDAIPSVAECWAHWGSFERSGREAWFWAKVDVMARKERRVKVAADDEEEGMLDYGYVEA